MTYSVHEHITLKRVSAIAVSPDHSWLAVAVQRLDRDGAYARCPHSFPPAALSRRLPSTSPLAALPYPLLKRLSSTATACSVGLRCVAGLQEGAPGRAGPKCRLNFLSARYTY